MRDEKFRGEGEGANAPLRAALIEGHDPLSHQSLGFFVQERYSTQPIVEKEEL